jgi:hypothetical protein
MGKSITIFSILLVSFLLIGTAYYFIRQENLSPVTPSPRDVLVKKNENPTPPEPTGAKPAAIKENEENKTEGNEETPFVALAQPAVPPFIDNLKNAADVKIDFHYEGDYTGDRVYDRPDYYVKGVDERFVSLSKLKDRTGEYAYGPEYQSVFSSEGSHWYGGTPVYLSDNNSKYSVAYVGLKMSDKDLISEMKAEFGIDFMADLDISRSKTPFFASLLGVAPVYACGPGIYLRRVGDSDLVFMEESNGITWYRLENPIPLYNLRLNFCDENCSLKPSYCRNLMDDPAECDKYAFCFYDVSTKTLANGNLRMHILYKANDKEGFLKLQMANLILTDPAGINYQPVMGKYFDHYYRAYLH